MLVLPNLSSHAYSCHCYLVFSLILPFIGPIFYLCHSVYLDQSNLSCTHLLFLALIQCHCWFNCSHIQDLHHYLEFELNHHKYQASAAGVNLTSIIMKTAECKSSGQILQQMLSCSYCIYLSLMMHTLQLESPAVWHYYGRIINFPFLELN